MTNLTIAIGALALVTAPSIPTSPARTAPAIASPAATPAAALGQRRAAPAPVTRASFVARIDNSYRALDTNHDGVVTADEIATGEGRARAATDAALLARRREAFARLDANHDGQLSQAEFDAAAAAMPRPAAADPAAIVAGLDSDHDSKLSLAEFRARALARFDRADKNHDGVVTPDEERTR